MNNFIEEKIEKLDEYDSMCAVCRCGIKMFLRQALEEQKKKLIDEIREKFKESPFYERYFDSDDINNILDKII